MFALTGAWLWPKMKKLEILMAPKELSQPEKLQTTCQVTSPEGFFCEAIGSPRILSLE